MKPSLKSPLLRGALLGTRTFQFCDGAPVLVRLLGNYVYSLPTHTLYRGSSFRGCSTIGANKGLYLTGCVLHISRMIFQCCPWCVPLPVFIKHQACWTAGVGTSTLRQSHPSVEGDRTVRWPPQGQRTILTADAPKATRLESPPHPPIPPFQAGKQEHIEVKPVMLYNCTASETDSTLRAVETSGALKRERQSAVS